MTRKLTHQQKRRIASLQQKRQAALETIDSTLAGPVQTGLLLLRHGRSALVEDAEGKQLHCHIRQNLQDVVAGDSVIWQSDESGAGVITAILPRKTTYTRMVSGAGKPLAANVDLLIIVFSPQPEPTPGLLDKYLLAAEVLSFKALLVCNKADLLTPDSHLQPILALYRDLGYPILEVSTLKNEGIAELKQRLRDHSSIIVGQSGVGKSSLVKALLPEELSVRVGAISEATNFGRHTTSNARYYHLIEGGSIIDSPGVRDLELGELTPTQIQQGFIECRPFLGQCKFRDCSHQHEPDCAVLAAVDKGIISSVRYQQFLIFLNQDS